VVHVQGHKVKVQTAITPPRIAQLSSNFVQSFISVASQQAIACTPVATSTFLQLTAVLACLFLRHFVMCDVSVQTLPRCIACNAVLAIVKPSLRPSACPSKRKFCWHSYTIWKDSSYSFLARRMVGGRRPILPEILGQTDPLPASKNGYFQSILNLNALAFTPSEKKFNYR